MTVVFSGFNGGFRRFNNGFRWYESGFSCTGGDSMGVLSVDLGQRDLQDVVVGGEQTGFNGWGSGSTTRW
ncbi:hypothetical protein HanIR_Chr09g0430481 [Helianthus annuus]|nr:hypothetical protein HanIR_Chr09g0430481 [Helianthus annuus]